MAEPVELAAPDEVPAMEVAAPLSAVEMEPPPAEEQTAALAAEPVPGEVFNGLPPPADVPEPTPEPELPTAEPELPATELEVAAAEWEPAAAEPESAEAAPAPGGNGAGTPDEVLHEPAPPPVPEEQEPSEPPRQGWWSRWVR